MADIDWSNNESDFEYLEADFVELEWDPEPEPDVLPQASQPRASDMHKQERNAIEEVVECMNHNGLRLDMLVHALCYGNPLCSSDNGKLKAARNQLMKSPKLSTILNNLHTPPSYTGSHPEATSMTLNEWAWNHVMKLA